MRKMTTSLMMIITLACAGIAGATSSDLPIGVTYYTPASVTIEQDMTLKINKDPNITGAYNLLYESGFLNGWNTNVIKPVHVKITGQPNAKVYITKSAVFMLPGSTGPLTMGMLGRADKYTLDDADRLGATSLTSPLLSASGEYYVIFRPTTFNSALFTPGNFTSTMTITVDYSL